MTTMPALPAYLQNRQSKKLLDDAAAGLGSSLPAHISVEGGVFTLIDGAGNAQRLTFTAQNGQNYQQPFLDACVIDVNPGLAKRYYGGKKWSPDSSDAPVCWSSNGIAPDRDAQQKQARTCGECKMNERGSATSEKSGVAIKACRDEKWLALVIPQTELNTVFRYVLTPGSLKKWKAYAELFRAGAVDLSDVLTRFEFDPDEPNTVKFTATNYIDENTAKTREAALAAGATDVIVGRTEQGAALPAPVAAPVLSPPPAQPAFAPTPPPAASILVAGNGYAVSPPAVAPAPVQAPARAPRGSRRTAAAPQAPAQQQMPLAAPFPTNAAPIPAPQSPPPAASHGMATGVVPDAALSATLASIFPGQ